MLYAILHNIRSLHNVGSIFRTADAAGVAKMYLCGITGTPPRKEIAKVALGAEQHVPWEYARRTVDVIKKLKKQGVCIVALEKTSNSIDYRDFDLVIARKTRERSMKQSRDRRVLQARDAISLALLVGNEVDGLPPALLRQADAVIHIPMRGKKESLNVSVAFGVVLYNLSSELFSPNGMHVVKT